MVADTGIEPVRYNQQILSLLRLPIPPIRHKWRKWAVTLTLRLPPERNRRYPHEESQALSPTLHNNNYTQLSRFLNAVLLPVKC